MKGVEAPLGDSSRPARRPVRPQDEYGRLRIHPLGMAAGSNRRAVRHPNTFPGVCGLRCLRKDLARHGQRSAALPALVSPFPAALAAAPPALFSDLPPADEPPAPDRFARRARRVAVDSALLRAGGPPRIALPLFADAELTAALSHRSSRRGLETWFGSVPSKAPAPGMSPFPSTPRARSSAPSRLAAARSPLCPATGASTS
ncbi:hypothetical protein DFJ74DRAFT_695801 [Hyaloraphidium curvatum]|nr:hypothetical protein DFJ74DRAFT_695801 [Hyaloraphidium curvatum]